MLDTVSRILFVVSTSVLVPVIVALLGIAVWLVLLFGGLLRETIARVSARRAMGDARRALYEDPRAGAERLTAVVTAGTCRGFLAQYLRACWAAQVTPLVATKVIDDIELAMARRVAHLSALARVGPMLGLAGTLIPLGPGLVNLARGDVAGLANQLVIAFSTTVVGLLIGMVGFILAQVRRGWYAADLADLLFLEELRSGQEFNR